MNVDKLTWIFSQMGRSEELGTGLRVAMTLHLVFHRKKDQVFSVLTTILPESIYLAKYKLF
ncbi:MAG: hypothetical protein VB110_01865 [Bacteroidales bacterium]|nr:hypothetical protein [Bacteroidales bacterium]